MRTRVRRTGGKGAKVEKSRITEKNQVRTTSEERRFRMAASVGEKECGCDGRENRKRERGELKIKQSS